MINYFVCVICGSLWEGSFPVGDDLLEQDWIWIAFGLGFLFIGGFNLNAMSVQRAGIAVTSVVQRISLLLSVSFAVLYFGDPLSGTKVLGILAGLMAVPLVVRLQLSDPLKNVPDLTTEKSGSTPPWVLPLAVFLVAGAIESALTVAQRLYQADDSVAFSVSLFAWAGILGLAFLLLRPSKGVPRMRLRELLGGIALGIPNFFSIYLILVALGEGVPATVVFPVLSVGTILLSTVLAFVLFKERLSPKQIGGMALAVLAIYLLV